jgi:hypothetical protein
LPTFRGLNDGAADRDRRGRRKSGTAATKRIESCSTLTGINAKGFTAAQGQALWVAMELGFPPYCGDKIYCSVDTKFEHEFTSSIWEILATKKCKQPG